MDYSHYKFLDIYLSISVHFVHMLSNFGYIYIYIKIDEYIFSVFSFLLKKTHNRILQNFDTIYQLLLLTSHHLLSFWNNTSYAHTLKINVSDLIMF